MQSAIIGMLAETFVHSGIGQANSAIDLPVARERTTDYPFIPGSGVKGAFKSWAKEQAGLGAEEKSLFGEADGAGAILFSDARLLLLPVRSLNSAYVWLTCPILLERLQRDVARAGLSTKLKMAEIAVAEGQYLGADRGQLLLEEREFTRKGEIPGPARDAVKTLVDGNAGSRIDAQMAIVSNGDFAWFAKFALPVSAHNKLDENKKSDNLWYEETLPPDTVMYCLLAERVRQSLSRLTAKLATYRYCQFGGNETLGQGWFHLSPARYE